MNSFIRFKPFLLLIVAVLSSLAACQTREEPEGFEILDRLRILAVKSEPADLVGGETATLSALVYDPDDRELNYSWSWCPARHDAREGFACAIEESDLKALWETLNTGTELPPYNLGQEPTAQFSNIFDGKAVFGICEALMEDQDADEFAILSCIWGLRPSVELRLRSGDEEWVAIKNLSVLLDEKEEERNANPEILPEMKAVNLLVPREKKSDLHVPVEPGEALYEGNRYELIANVGVEHSELFHPEKSEGVETPTQKKENLYINWFVTKDAVNYPLDGTLFVDGEIDFESLVTNEFQMAETVKSKEVRFFLVLRDERGGVGWMDYQFNVEAGE